jgi:hypothetical protein
VLPSPEVWLTLPSSFKMRSALLLLLLLLFLLLSPSGT